MWIQRFASIFLWISIWGLFDLVLKYLKLSSNQLGIIYVIGICITSYIISKEEPDSIKEKHLRECSTR